MKIEDFLVLLVEDDSDQVVLMKAALGRANLVNPLQVAIDGEQAIAYLAGDGEFADRRKYPLPSMVLLDLKLPRVSGLEVLEWIRRQPRFKNLPVVVLTSSYHSPDIQKAYSLGVNSYLHKPIGFSDLAEMMKSVGMYWMILNQAPEEPQSRSEPGLAVLVLDEDRDFLDSVSAAFARREPPVAVSGTGSVPEALNLLGRGTFVAMICAKEIPGISNLSLLAVIRSARPNIPIFVVADDEDPDYAERSVLAGARAVWTRSARLKTFLDRIHAAVVAESAPAQPIPSPAPAAESRAYRSSDTELMGPQVQFQRTSWDLVRSSSQSGSMEILIKAYWKPLYFFARQRGLDNETAKDVTQDFIASMMERGTIGKADPARGRFRTFLLAALTNFMKDRAKETSRQKRGGGRSPLSLDFVRGENEYRLEAEGGEIPEKAVDRAWARELLNFCVGELQGDPGHLKAFSLYVAGDSYESINRRTGLSISAAKTAVHRLKTQLRETVTRHLRGTVSTDEEFQEELSDFLSILSTSSREAATLLTPS